MTVGTLEIRIEEYNEAKHDLASLNQEDAQGSTRIFLDNNNTIVGYAIIDEERKNEVIFIHYLRAVNMRQGVGSAMVTLIKEYYTKSSYKALCLETTKKYLAFWKKNGAIWRNDDFFELSLTY